MPALASPWPLSVEAIRENLRANGDGKKGGKRTDEIICLSQYRTPVRRTCRVRSRQLAGLERDRDGDDDGRTFVVNLLKDWGTNAGGGTILREFGLVQEELRTGWLASLPESQKQTQMLRLGFVWDLVLRPALFLRPLSFPPASRPHTPRLLAIMRPSPSLLKRSRIKLPTRSNIFPNDHYDQPLVPLRAVRLPFFFSSSSYSSSSVSLLAFLADLTARLMNGSENRTGTQSTFTISTNVTTVPSRTALTFPARGTRSTRFWVGARLR